MDKPLILVTNDDGIMAPGLRSLVKFMLEIGRVVVVAPDKAQSGMGHAVTLEQPLRIEKLGINASHVEYSCSGTPVDCVKIAINSVLHCKPDLVVSGINHGSNSSINVIYSGTMSATIQGAMAGIPSIGFSLLDFRHNADFLPSKKYVQSIAKNVLKNRLPRGVCLNVNIPAISGKKIKGIKICRQASGNWIEEFDHRKDPRGRDYYWLTGKFQLFENSKETDEWALAHNYVSVVPTQFDFTAHNFIPEINKWEFE